MNDVRGSKVANSIFKTLSKLNGNKTKTRFLPAMKFLECMEVRHHGTDSADSVDSAPGWRGTELAL
jgi:hypothetical protein